MKLHTYIIKHTKDSWGRDQFCIYHKWFNFITFPYYEYEITTAICDNWKYQKYKRFYSYASLEDAKNALNKYLTNPKEIYKGYTITRYHNDMWLVKSSGSCPYKHDWLEYSIGGTLELCKKYIDEDIEKTNNENFKEIIEL